MILRPATQDDARVLASIHRHCFLDPWSEESFRRLLEPGGAFALLGRSAAATDLQSFILVQVAAGESEILTIATMPDARRTGLARALLLAAAAEAMRRQAGVMFLEVAEDNEAAFGLYRSLGFSENGRRRFYYRRVTGPAVDALMLRAPLPLPVFS